MTSIRVFLVVVILAVFTLFNFIAALRGYQSSMEKAELLFDQHLLETAKIIANIHTENTANNIDHNSHIAFQVWQNGQLMASSSNTPMQPIATLQSGFNYSNFDGYRWRTFAYRNLETSHWILVAERTDLRFTLAENVILESIFPVLVGLPVVGLLIWLIVSHGLRPLRRLANEMGSKQPTDLSPLSTQAPQQELAQIVASSNGLLERLETSLQREKQFASNAAHELRTPISTLKVQLYNIKQTLNQGTETDALEATAQRLEHIVEQILALYKNSPDQYNARFEKIELSELTEEVLAEESPYFDAKQQQLEFNGCEAYIMGDPFALKTLLKNLLSNANKYTPAEGCIKVSMTKLEDHLLLSIEDSGPGIDAKQRDRIFERFYRIDGDRHPSGEMGCGLGLAIVKHIVELHHATIQVTPSSFATGSAFKVLFPLHQPENSNHQPGTI
ncbi:sensor histidine kinase [gamma proteobacterium IMCC2047]|nr:sensor histidine kinase [gamma proteobacterium IMCC2047]